MTDADVENIMINKFLDAESLGAIAKCHKYYQDNKEAETVLDAFYYWKPIYPSGSTEEDKAKIDGPIEYFNEDSLINWFSYDYPNRYKTEDGTADEDELYEAIKNIVIHRDPNVEIQRKLTLYNTDGDAETIYIYPVVFENLVSERTAISEGFTKAWYEVYFIPSPPELGEIYHGAKKWYSGIFQINICVPKNMGTQDIKVRYNEIVDLFKAHWLDKGIRIENVYRAANITEEDFTWCPVSIDWKAYLK